MKKTIKIILLMILTGVFAIGAYSQTDDSKPEKLVLEKLNEAKSIDFLINPGETKEVVIVEIKMLQSLFFSITPAGKQEDSSKNNTSSNSPQSGGSMGGVVAGARNDSSSSQVVASSTTSIRETTPAKINWIVKKDGKEIATGSDEVTYTRRINDNARTAFDYEKNYAHVNQIGTYTVALKCVEKTFCNYKLSLSLVANTKAPDPVNLEP